MNRLMDVVPAPALSMSGPSGVAFERDPLADLRADRPDLFESPPFWPTAVGDIQRAAEGARRAEVAVLGRSSGGRPIWSFAYGDFEPQQPTATISSAWASDRPAAFFDPARRSRPALLLIGTIHGGESEGVATAMNLIAVLETGCDLTGRAQPALRELFDATRVVIVPCLNPDGRERAGVRHLMGAELEDLFLVQQGLFADGTPLRGRKVKEMQPMDPARMRLLGAYYNDAGVNLQHDDFFSGRLAPENQALADLMRREMFDGFLTFHAHGADTAFLGPDAYLSPGYQRRQLELAGFISAELLARGHAVLPPQRCVSPPWSFNFQCFFHHVAGALPLLCELPHGLRIRPHALEEILTMGLITLAGWARFAGHFGLRPPAMELHGETTPA